MNHEHIWDAGIGTLDQNGVWTHEDFCRCGAARGQFDSAVEIPCPYCDKPANEGIHIHNNTFGDEPGTVVERRGKCRLTPGCIEDDGHSGRCIGIAPPRAVEKQKLIDPAPNRRYDEVYEEGVKWLNEPESKPVVERRGTDNAMNPALNENTLKPRTKQ